MWELRTALRVGSVSTRNLFLFVALLIATVFSTLFLVSAPAYAAGDAKWVKSGEEVSLEYQGNTYNGPLTSASRAGYDLPDNTIIFTNTSATTGFGGQKGVKVIYFPSDATLSEQTTAQYVTYSLGNSGNLTDKSTPVEITIDENTASVAPNLGENSDDGATSCAVGGIGYIICPVTTFLAEGMDWIFDKLKAFLFVEPLSTRADSTMRRAWEVMRSFANVAFVIAFIVIIYSQLTSFGVSNYGIKKLLPRIIIAAILVNTSYWIATIAIDISNVLGESLQKLFIDLRNLLNIKGNSDVQWNDVASFILAGGAAGTLAISGVVMTTASVASVGGLVFLILPILAGAALTVLVVLFILAARQALITLLVIIAPLAFVAYLLPNTEKWFEKWRSLFMTMLIFFPAFSAVFGGAQLAGAMIIANSNGDITIAILGLAVQIAPLAITPLLLKLSGSLLSKIAGIVNDPSRGFKDKTKNWAKERGEEHRTKQLAKTREMAKAGTLGKRHVMRRNALAHDNRRRIREGRKANYDSMNDNYFNDSKAGHALDDAKREVEREKNRVHSVHESHWNIKAKIDPESLHEEIKVRLAADKAQLAKDDLSNTYDEITAGSREHIKNIYGEGYNKNDISVRNNRTTQERLEMLNAAQDTATYLAAEGMRKTATSNEKQRNFANIIEQKEDTPYNKQHNEIAEMVAKRAGGIDEHGVDRIRANASNTIEQLNADAIKNQISLIQDRSTSDTLVGNARETFIQANKDGDVIKARAAAKILSSQTGSKGKQVFGETIDDIERTDGFDEKVKISIKYDATAAGLKGQNVAVDSWATSPSSTMLADVIRDYDKTVKRLNQSELAGQSVSHLKKWADTGILTKEQATAVMAAHHKGSLPLDEEKIAVFKRAAGGSRRSTP